MIFIVPDIKSHFDAQVKAGDKVGQSDIITDQLAKIIHDNKDAVISLLKDSRIELSGTATKDIATALADGLSRDEKFRKNIAALILSSDYQKISGAAGDIFSGGIIGKIKDTIADPAKQDSIKNVANGFIDLFGKGADKKEAAVSDIVDKTTGRKPAEAPKSYVALYATLGGVVVLGLGIWIYKALTKEKPDLKLGAGAPAIAAAGAVIPLVPLVPTV